MTYGFTIVNSAGEVTVSDKTYNLVYYGRASVTFIGTIPSYPRQAYNYVGVGSTPFLGTWDFSINVPSGTTTVIPFLSSSDYCCLMYVKQNTATQWIGEVFSVNAPTVYCFIKLPQTTPVTGNGIAVFDNAGKPAYISTQRHLIPKQVGYTSAPAANPSYYNAAGGNYVGYYPNQTTTTYTFTSTVSNPIIYYPSGNSSVASASVNSWFFEICAKVTTTNISTRWGLSYVGYGTNYYNQPARDILAIVADGATFT